MKKFTILYKIERGDAHAGGYQINRKIANKLRSVFK